MNSCQRQYHHARKELQALQVDRPRRQTTPQPEETTTTSASPGSFYTNPENAATAAPKAAPQPPTSPAVADETPNRQQTAAQDVPLRANFGQ